MDIAKWKSLAKNDAHNTTIHICYEYEERKFNLPSPIQNFTRFLSDKPDTDNYRVLLQSYYNGGDKTPKGRRVVSRENITNAVSLVTWRTIDSFFQSIADPDFYEELKITQVTTVQYYGSSQYKSTVNKLQQALNSLIKEASSHAPVPSSRQSSHIRTSTTRVSPAANNNYQVWFSPWNELCERARLTGLGAPECYLHVLGLNPSPNHKHLRILMKFDISGDAQGFVYGPTVFDSITHECYLSADRADRWGLTACLVVPPAQSVDDGVPEAIAISSSLEGRVVSATVVGVVDNRCIAASGQPNPTLARQNIAKR